MQRTARFLPLLTICFAFAFTTFSIDAIAKSAEDNIKARSKRHHVKSAKQRSVRKKYRRQVKQDDGSVKIVGQKPASGPRLKSSRIAKEGRLPFLGKRQDSQLNKITHKECKKVLAYAKDFRGASNKGLEDQTIDIGLNKPIQGTKEFARLLKACNSQIKALQTKRFVEKRGKANPRIEGSKKRVFAPMTFHRSGTRSRVGSKRNAQSFADFLANPEATLRTSKMSIANPKERQAGAPLCSAKTAKNAKDTYDWYYEPYYFLFDDWDYGNNLDDELVTIFAPQGADAMRMHFSWFDMENGNDWIDLYDGYDEYCETITGTDLYDIWSTDCYGDFITIWVHTDYAWTYDGFEIDGIEYAYVTYNEPPVAIAEADAFSVPAGEITGFYGDSSYDPDGWIADYEWDFDDGTTSSQVNPRKVFNSVGIHDVLLTVWDDLGEWAQDVISIDVYSENLPPIAIATASNYYPEIAESVFFQGSNSYDPDGYIRNCEWDFGGHGASTSCDVNHTFWMEGDYTVTLTVWDDQGYSSFDSFVVSVGTQAQITDFYLVAAAAKARGQGGSDWVTDLSIFNPTDTTITVRVDYIPARGATDLGFGDVDIPAGETFFYPDVIDSFFGYQTGNGALENQPCWF
jgi:hypothetical protein